MTETALAAGSLTETRYDANGNLASLTDANGNATSYTHDDFDRLTRMTYADGSSEQYAYDAASNLVSLRTPNSELRTYAYDALHRLTSQVTPQETTTYTYDRGSRLTAVADADAALTYAYDALNRVTQVSTDPAGPLAVTTVGYTYDAAGNRTTLTYPDADVITYTYDALNRLDLLKDAAAATLADFDYDVLSRRAKLTLASTVFTSYTYDAASRLTAVATKKPGKGNKATTLLSASYTYDALGNRLSLADGAGTHAYTYDPISQVTNVDHPASFAFPDTAFAYDKLGNRTTVNTTPYTANPLNQYTQVGAAALTHDPNGNLTNDGTTTYTYDAENRLSSIQLPASSVQFTYDPLGRRLSKTVGGVTTRFLYDGDQLLAETDAAGTLTAKYVYGLGIDEPLRMVRGGGTSYFHQDGLGSVVGLTDPTGAIVERYAYDVYGQPRITTGSGTVLTQSTVGNRYLFTGREYDAETGLYFYRARYYNPSVGRFLQRDPLGYLPDENLYRYAKNNPVNLTDPDGRNPLVAILAIGAGFGAVTALFNAFIASGSNFTVTKAAAAVAVGAVVGVGVTAAAIAWPSVAGTAISSGFFAAGGSAAYQSLTGTNLGDLNATAIGLSLITGAATGAYAAGVVAPAWKPLFYPPAFPVGPVEQAFASKLAVAFPFSMTLGPLAAIFSQVYPVKLGDILDRLQSVIKK